MKNTISLASLACGIAMLAQPAHAQYYQPQPRQAPTYYSNPYYEPPVRYQRPDNSYADGEDFLNNNVNIGRRYRGDAMDFELLNKPMHDSRMYFNAGIRTDNLQWNIASDITGTATPNILSELTWTDLSIFEVRGGIQHHVKSGVFRNFYVEAEGYAGGIFDGQNQDSDYNGNNRTLEFSRSNNNTDTGEVLGGRLGLGYTFSLTRYPDSSSRGNVVSLTPVAGWSIHQQKLSITDGFQTIPATGSFPGLDSSYDSTWHGPFVGARMEIRLKDKHRFNLSGDLNYANYSAVANWNLRPTFQHPKSFEHDATGTGYRIAAEYGYRVSDKWELSLNFNYDDWSAKDGTDRTFFTSGATATTKFNEVNWDSYSYRAGVTYRF